MDPAPYQFEDAPTPPPPEVEGTDAKQSNFHHTKFLDLTNGEGGGTLDPYADDDDDDEEEDDDQMMTLPPGMMVEQLHHYNHHRPAESMAASTNFESTPSSKGKKSKVDPSNPGKVVETGQEHTGRWTKEEHEAFLNALKIYGKEWKKVAAKVKTRTVVQTRTHAQKYFQKLQKAMESGEPNVDEVPMGTGGRSTSGKKKRATSSSASDKAQGSTSRAMFPRQNSVTSAAHLISHMSSDAAADSPYHQNHHHHADAADDGGFIHPQEQPESRVFSPAHGFTTYTTPSAAPASDWSSDYTLQSSKPMDFPMKIVAPEHDAASKRGKFPEPSPAACGKRKLAEIAAARMLAGVFGGVGDGSDDSKEDTSNEGGDDGFATPPPEEVGTAKAHIKDIPAPPIIPPSNNNNNSTSNNNSNKKPGFGLSLQIVNPESLGVSYESQQKKRKEGNNSPQTPWEGQLAALVSEEKKKEPAPAPSDLPPDPSILGTSSSSFATASSGHPVCGPGATFNRNTLHKAVCEMDMAGIQGELSSRPREFFQRADSKGFCPIHSACALCLKDPQNSGIATEIVRVMTNAGADVSVADSEGNTPLHWAARAGDKSTAEFLLLKASPTDAKNDRGETPLHWALRAGRRGIPVASVLLDNGARAAIWSKEFKRPIEVAADGFHDEENSVIDLKKMVAQRKRLTKDQRRVLKDAMEERKEARANLLMISAQSRTLVLHHPECLQHIPKASSDWENPDRVKSILDKLIGNALPTHIHEHEITVSQDFERAKLDLLKRIHSTDYLNFVNELSKDLERQHKEQNGGDEETEEWRKPLAVPFTPMVQRSMIKVAESSVKLGSHSDTSFSVGSLRAARRAAGAVQHAVDCVLIGRNRNSFCVVRPPGHHAGVNGLLDGGESCGFCIFNSVAAGAMHAISDERLLCERCAIIDIDVHHGNGTEEIVRKCHDPGKLFFFSTHLYDNERKGKKETKSFQYKFYPGTGDEDDVALNIINVPIAPLWKEKDSGTTAAATHKTRHRTRQRSSRESDDGSGGNSDSESDPRASPAVSSTPSTPNPNNGMGGRTAYRKAIQNRLLPALRAFNPDLILISAGFDACKGDVGNAKHEFGSKEKTGIDLEPEDYAWTTRKILEIADICCQGRVVSVLEGGYGRTPATAEPGDNVPLDKSAFSDCAIRHVHAMIDPYDTETRFGTSS